MRKVIIVLVISILPLAVLALIARNVFICTNPYSERVILFEGYEINDVRGVWDLTKGTAIVHLGNGKTRYTVDGVARIGPRFIVQARNIWANDSWNYEYPTEYFVVDIATGQIEAFASLAKVCRHLGVPAESVNIQTVRSMLCFGYTPH